MRQNDKFYLWQKGDKSFLNEYFSCLNFDCKCDYDDCVDQKISIELIEKLSELWKRQGRIEITSGFRCEKKQRDIQKSGISTVVAQKSAHEIGLAADIRSPDKLLALLKKDIEELFMNIGYAINFFHVDVRPPKPDGTKRTWKY